MTDPGPLTRRLTEIREAGAAKRPPAVTATLKRATDELRASGILDGIPSAGDRAPLFARPNLEGETVRLRAALRKGPVVLSFFRGRW
jgi:hypothetical protein